MPSPPPPMTHFPIVIPYPGAPGAPFFDGQNITHFLDLYDQLCSDYRLSESEKIYRLPWYCEFFIGRYIRILIKDADWTAAREILRREYKDNDLGQPMNSREFLEALKKKPRSEDDDLIQYCYMFASISKDLVSRKRLDLYTQCQWFLQGLPGGIVMEIFYRYNIDLEDDDDLDFGDLLEKVLVLVKRRKFLADFIQDKETDLVHKYTEPQKVPTTLNIVESSSNPNPPTRIQAVQGAVQEDIPVVRVHASRIVEFKAGEVRSGVDDCMLISDPAEYFYEDLGTLFNHLKPRDEEVGQLSADSVTVVEPFDDTIGLRKYAHRPNSSCKRTPSKFLNSFDAGIGAKKKAGMIPEKRHAGFDGIVVGRGVIKSEDHG